MTPAGFEPPAEFAVIDRAQWARISQDRAPDGAGPPPESPVGTREWEEVYAGLGHLLALYLESRAELNHRLVAAGLPGAGRGAAIIGLGGSVSAGKSTLAHALAAILAAGPGRPSVAVVSTDGFLLPNAVLGPLGRAGYKGFPDTYDHELIAKVLGALATGAEYVEIPTYSHDVYDIAGAPQILHRPDIVILEGVNALAAARWCAVRIYLDADERVLRRWYVDRFLAHIDDARVNPTSFFAQWTAMSTEEAGALAVSVWEAVNLRNLDEHILPTRWSADLVLRMGPAHDVEAIAIRAR